MLANENIPHSPVTPEPFTMDWAVDEDPFHESPITPISKGKNKEIFVPPTIWTPPLEDSYTSLIFHGNNKENVPPPPGFWDAPPQDSYNTWTYFYNNGIWTPNTNVDSPQFFDMNQGQVHTPSMEAPMTPRRPGPKGPRRYPRPSTAPHPAAVSLKTAEDYANYPSRPKMTLEGFGCDFEDRPGPNKRARIIGAQPVHNLALNQDGPDTKSAGSPGLSFDFTGTI